MVLLQRGVLGVNDEWLFDNKEGPGGHILCEAISQVVAFGNSADQVVAFSNSADQVVAFSTSADQVSAFGISTEPNRRPRPLRRGSEYDDE
ncbi:MAG: hypothetical protein C5B49_09670 [Bdellovibrio sp.]|nr:MAG: hypothetical protein C5B49_09670 [Bdellovibrio sp.]